MKLKLICSNPYQLLLKDFLEARNFEIKKRKYKRERLN